MKQFVITVTGAVSCEDAFSFYCNQAHADFGVDVYRIIAGRGFKRTLLCKPAIADHIKRRLGKMHMNSPNEFIWMGEDENGKSSYIIYGLVPDIGEGYGNKK